METIANPFIRQLAGKMSTTTTARAGLQSSNIASVFSPKTPIYYLKGSYGEHHRRAVLAALTLCGKVSIAKPTAWQTYVLTWTVCLFPELTAAISNSVAPGDYDIRELPDSFVEQCFRAAMEQKDEATRGPKVLSFPVGLPSNEVMELTPQVIAASTGEGLVAYYSMMFFIMGKSLAPEKIASLSNNRPEALIRSRNLTGSAYILTGAGKMDPACYPSIQSGWMRSGTPRIVLVKHLAHRFQGDKISEVWEPLQTNLRMLKNSGQTYMVHILKLLTSYEWVMDMPIFKSAIIAFAGMADELASVDDLVRPFYKLAYQDKAANIRRRDVEVLIATAIFVECQNSSSMSNYRISQSCLGAVEKFREEAAKRGITFNKVTHSLAEEANAI